MRGSPYRVQAANACRKGLNPVEGTFPLQGHPAVRLAAGAIVDLAKVGPFLSWLATRWPLPSIPIVINSSVRAARGQAGAMLNNFKSNGGGAVGDLSSRGARYLLGLYGADNIIEALVRTPQTTEQWAAVIDSYQRKGQYLSQHMRGTAVDLRCWNMTDADRRQVASVIDQFPGAEVVLESNHIHVEGLRGAVAILPTPAPAQTAAPPPGTGARLVRDREYLYRMEPSGQVFIVESPNRSSWPAREQQAGRLVTDPGALASIQKLFAVPAPLPAPALPAPTPAPAPAPASQALPLAAPEAPPQLVQAPAFIPDLSPLPDVLEPTARAVSDVVAPYLPDPATLVPFYAPGPRDAGAPTSLWSKPSTWIALGLGASVALSLGVLSRSRS